MNHQLKLSKLVPDFETCRKIPSGEFNESVFVYWYDALGTNITLDFREGAAVWKDEIAAPAPTLEEILSKMADYPHIYNNFGIENDGSFYIACAFIPYKGKPGKMLKEVRENNASAAALKLYLEHK